MIKLTEKNHKRYIQNIKYFFDSLDSYIKKEMKWFSINENMQYAYFGLTYTFKLRLQTGLNVFNQVISFFFLHHVGMPIQSAHINDMVHDSFHKR